MSTRKSIINQGESFLVKFLERAVTFFFSVILLLTILLVTLRYLFNSSIMGGNEMMDYLFIYTTSLGAAVSVCKKEHIRIAFFVDKLPQALRQFIDVVNYLLVAGINLVIAYLSFSWIQTVGNAESPVMRIPMWMIEVSVPLGCLFVVLFCLTGILNVYWDRTERRQ
ncbi:MAG: TRAP transporter small permease [Deltaproteobacteria bacterium]|nr:TRAP transporter small permease [Deltaproteobacteria bacterium]